MKLYYKKGAEHLKMASRHLNLLQYFCVDVLAFLVASCAVVGISSRKLLIQILPRISRFDVSLQTMPVKVPVLVAFATAIHYAHISKHISLF